jgi:8-oxo-dGTP diphosphatase
MGEPAEDWVPIAAAVIAAGGRVLLIRRAVAEGGLSWQFPAGKVEPGESAEDAAVRQAFEETGVVVRALVRLGERVHPLTGRIMLYVACE